MKCCMYCNLKNNSLTLKPLSYTNKIFTHLQLCLPTETHNFKRVKNHICLIWDKTFANLDV